MIQISQNPKLRIIGLCLMTGGVILLCVSYRWWLPGFGIGLLLNIIALLLANIGTDTALTEEGFKLGFTRLDVSDLSDIYENGKGEIVLVTKSRRRLRLKRWHYEPSEWPGVRDHLLTLGYLAQPTEGLQPVG